MKVFKCDLCGKYYDGYVGAIDDVNCNTISIVNTEGLYDPRNHKMYDTCPDCLTAFSQFLYGRQHPQKKKVLDQEGWRGE